MAKIKSSSSVPQKNRKSISAATKNTKPGVRRTYLSKLCDDLEKAATGLLHTSESDFPYDFFALRQRDMRKDSDKLTVLEFLGGTGLSQELIDEYKIPVGELIEERAFDDFFPSIADIAEYYGSNTSDRKVVAESKRYRKLEALLQKRLEDVKVFRVGKIEIRCYIAGFTKHGGIAGLVTTAIET